MKFLSATLDIRALVPLYIDPNQIRADEFCSLVKQTYNWSQRSRSELPMTETELRAMAAAAIIGDRTMPKLG